MKYRKYIEANVLEEARARVSHLYDTMDTVVVSFSGGKDSLVTLHLAHEAAQARGIDKVKVCFYDEELIPSTVIDFVNGYRQLPWVDMTWYALPMRNEKFILGDFKQYIQWDSARPHVRPRPPWSIGPDQVGMPDKACITQPGINRLIAQQHPGKIAVITGIRAIESPARNAGIMAKLSECWITETSPAGPHPENLVSAKPIYDWLEADVFRYFYDHGIQYCPIYDSQASTRTELRVSTPFNAQSAKRLGLLRSIDPVFYDQIIEAFPEMEVQERYFRELNRDGMVATYGKDYDGVTRYINENILDPSLHAMAMKQLKHILQHPEKEIMYPPDELIKLYARGQYKRGIMPLNLADQEAYRRKQEAKK